MTDQAPPNHPALKTDEPANLTHEQALERLKMRKVYEFCAANPKADPYLEMTAVLLRDFPDDEDQILLNFIDALSVSNMKMKAIIVNQGIELQSMRGDGLVIPTNENVRRGHGPIPMKRKEKKS